MTQHTPVPMARGALVASAEPVMATGTEARASSKAWLSIDADEEVDEPTDARGDRFVSYATYNAPRTAIDRVFPDHSRYAEKLRAQGHVVIAGPITAADGERKGVVFIYRAASREEALSFVEHDPFMLAGVVGSHELTGWHRRGARPDIIQKIVAAQDQPGREQLFLNYALYRRDRARLEKARPLHHAYARRLLERGQLVLAGPLADNRGALLIYAARSLAEALSLRDDDPFQHAGVYAATKISGWTIKALTPALL